MSKIFITSYPYVYERYFRIWDYFPEKERLIFILPQRWSAKDGKIQVQTPRRDNLKIYPVPAYFTHSRYPLVRGLLKGWMPQAKNIIKQQAKPGDILYTAIEPNLLTTYFNSRLAKKLGLKHVFFTWQNIPYRQRLSGLKLKFTEAVLRATVRNSAGVICGNTKAAEILQTYAGKDFKILTAPISGVDTDCFKPELISNFRQKYRLENKIVLTFAGVFDERKGVILMLEAFFRAQTHNKNLHLVLIGTGPLEKEIKIFIQKNNLSALVTVIFWLANEELSSVLANSDIFIHPSQPFGGWEEQFGYSMAEASACGLPVISTRSGSIEEIVLDQKSGILVEPGQIESLAEAILKLATDDQERKNLGLAGRKHIEENFSHEIVAKKFHNFFKEI